MKLTFPVEISPRLLPGIRIGQDWISVEESPGRNWQYVIDTQLWSYGAADLRGPHGAAAAVSTLITFLQASAESYRASMSGRSSDNADLFPPHVAEWAYVHEDELLMSWMELERTAE